MAYIDSDLEVKEPDAEQEAQKDTDTRGEILCDVIRIINAHSH